MTKAWGSEEWPEEPNEAYLRHLAAERDIEQARELGGFLRALGLLLVAVIVVALYAWGWLG